MLFYHVRQLLFVVDYIDVADRIRKILSILEGPVLHEGVGTNDQTVQEALLASCIYRFFVLILHDYQRLQGLSQSHVITKSPTEVITSEEAEPCNSFELIRTKFNVLAKFDEERVVEIGSVFEVFDELYALVGDGLQFGTKLAFGNIGVNPNNDVREAVHGYVMEFDVGDDFDDL